MHSIYNEFDCKSVRQQLRGPCVTVWSGRLPRKGEVRQSRRTLCPLLHFQQESNTNE